MHRSRSENHHSHFNPRLSLVQYRSLYHDFEDIPDGGARLRVPKWRLVLLALIIGLMGAGVLHFVLLALG